jgi:hypothetical protein
MVTVDPPRRMLVGLLVATAVLLAVWSLAIPVFEAPDEPAHWQYARFLTGRLSACMSFLQSKGDRRDAVVPLFVPDNILPDRTAFPRRSAL